jgi:DNA invertase Pin-like site-specific DNA recombinase
VAYKSFTEQYFDSCGVFKDAVIAIMATVAKQERVKRSERTKAGLARVRAEGRTLGRPRLELQSAQIIRLRAQGLSLRAIGRNVQVADVCSEDTGGGSLPAGSAAATLSILDTNCTGK